MFFPRIREGRSPTSIVSFPVFEKATIARQRIQGRWQAKVPLYQKPSNGSCFWDYGVDITASSSRGLC